MNRMRQNRIFPFRTSATAYLVVVKAYFLNHPQSNRFMFTSAWSLLSLQTRKKKKALKTLKSLKEKLTIARTNHAPWNFLKVAFFLRIPRAFDLDFVAWRPPQNLHESMIVFPTIIQTIPLAIVTTATILLAFTRSPSLGCEICSGSVMVRKLLKCHSS